MTYFFLSLFPSIFFHFFPKNNKFIQYFSPQFFYNNRFNNYDNDTNNDEGMYSRDVMKLLKNIGICSEEIYPYGKIEDKSPNHLKMFRPTEGGCA